MNYYMIVEPMIKNAYWCNKYIEGIKYEVQRIKGKLIECDFKDLADIKKRESAEGCRPVVIVNCISKSFIPDCLEKLSLYDIHPLLLTPLSKLTLANVSTVSLDFFRVFYSLCAYLSNINRNKTALFGLNPSSANDSIKKEAFSTYQKKISNNIEEHIYWNNGSLEECCNKFYENINNYDSAICVNDIVAIKLLNFLKNKNVSVPEEIFIATIGNTVFSSIINPKITVAEFDCFEIGRQAVKMYTMLAKNPDLSSLTATVSGEINVSELTGQGFIKPGNYLTESLEKKVNFYTDVDVKNIFKLENLFSNCDDLDLDIIDGLISRKKYGVLAAELHTTENTIKYRIKKMLILTESKNRSELINLLTEYLKF